MFNKSQLDVYSNIKAPDELFEKVTNSKPKKNKIYLIPFVSTLAACLVFVFGIAVFRSSLEPQVTFNGQSLTDSVVFYDVNPISIMDARSSPVLSLTMVFELSEETLVSVSEGVMVLENGDRASEAVLNGEVNLIWEIQSGNEFSESEMILKSHNGLKKIILNQSEADGSYTAKIN